MKIRKVQIQDSAGLARVQVDSYRTAYAGILPQAYLDHFTYQEQTQDWQDLLAAGLDDVLYVAETDAGEVVGYALGRPGLCDIPPYDSELVALHVRPAYQGQGIGRRLITTAAKELQGRGCTSLMLWVLEKNPARALYERLGGQRIGEKDWDGNAELGTDVKEVAYGWPNIEGLRKQAIHPTPYKHVNAVLNRLLADAKSILGDDFVGMYLYGSLASGGSNPRPKGDFDPQHSDIDFVVVTAGELSQETVQTLEAMHARLTASGLPGAEKLEGAYVPRHVLRRHDPRHPPCPCVNEGHFYRAPLGSDWVIQRHVLREQGRVVAGPAPSTLIDPVAPDAVQDAVRGFLREWWAPMLQKPDPRLHGAVYQAYAVLTMCRALYTLRTGAIVSKSRAAQWAQQTLDPRWSVLIEWAKQRGDAPPQSIDEVLAFIRHTLEQGQVDTVVPPSVPSKGK